MSNRGEKCSQEDLTRLRNVIDKHGVKKVAEMSGVGQDTVGRACAGGGVHRKIMRDIMIVIDKLKG